MPLPVKPDWIDWANETTDQENTTIRRSLCLNNYWQFIPQPESLLKNVIARSGELPSRPSAPPAWNGRWFGKVPGRWDAGGNYLLFDFSKNPVETIGGASRSDYTQGWYRRSVFIPEAWKGKRIFLEFDSVSERATVVLNGKESAPFTKTGKIDITDRVIFGGMNDLSVFVEISSLPVKPGDARFKEFTTPGMGTRWWYGWRPGPGITGDVWLHAIPAGIRFEKVFIQPHVSGNRLDVSAELKNTLDSEMSVKVSAEVFDGSARVFAIAPETLVLPAGKSRMAIISGIWKNPVCWSPENPKLYALKFRVTDRNGKLLDEDAIRFGFREFTVENGNFLLNGKKIRLKFDSSQYNYDRLSDEEIRRACAELKKMNFNGFIIESVDKRIYRIADETGMMIAMRHVFPPLVREGTYLPGVPNKGYPAGIYFSRKLAGAKAELEATVRGIVEDFRNHPSLVIWAINPLLCYNSEWIHPNRLDADRAVNDIIHASFKEEAFIRSLDPSRPVLHSMGSNTGGIIAANPYPTFSNPPDEWADWPSKWASRKKKPLLLEEVAVPFCFDFANWYKASARRDTSWEEKHQLFFETGARYFGDTVYASCRNDMSDTLWHQRADRMLSSSHGIRYASLNPVAEAVEKLWIERCLRAWRIYGVDGIWPFYGLNAYFSDATSTLRPMPEGRVTAPGKKPDLARPANFDYPAPIAAVLRETFDPFLAYLGGRPDHFTSREHNYYEGDAVVKTMLFSNDSLEPCKIEAEWKAVCSASGKVLASGKWSGILSAGESGKVPFEWTAPSVKNKTECRIEFRASANGKIRRDSFDVTVFPKHSGRNFAEVVLYDENGAASAMLRKAGVPFTKEFSGKNLDRCGILYVGRDSLTRKFMELSRKENVSRRLENGLKMVVFSQGTETELGEKLEERRTRAVFVKDSLHPVLKGLSGRDLEYWRGESKAVEPYPDSPSSVRNMRFMRWGTEGSVATFVLDKPFSGNFRVILDSDFDLSRAALLELFPGKGKLIFCQLDLEDRYGSDPAATLLADNLFAYSGEFPPHFDRRLVYSGPAKGADFLRSLGFEPETLPRKQALKQASSGAAAVIFDDSVPVTEAIRLAKLPAFPEAVRGIGRSDLYFNPAVRIPEAPLAVEKNGIGTVVRLFASPDAIREEYSRAKFKRVVSTLLTNLGIRSAKTPVLNSETSRNVILPETVPFRIDPENKGLSAGWFKKDFNDSSWRKLKLGFPWESQGIRDNNSFAKSAAAYPYDGLAWYRISFVIPPEMKGKKLFFEADSIDDLDDTWFNGVKIGHTGEDTPEYWQFRRKYAIPPEVIAWGGKNTVAVRVNDLRGEGGILGETRITDGGVSKPASLFFEGSPRNIFDFDPNSWRQW